MEFARRGRPATAAADADHDDGRRSPDPTPPHGAGDAMLVIRDALLSQLQKDHLRQEIIRAELAKIERTMALLSATHCDVATDNVEWCKPVFFTFSEKFMPHHRWLEHCSDVEKVNDLEKKDVRHGSMRLKSGKPSIEYHFVECSRPCCSNGKAGEENAAFDEQKLQGSNETIQPKKMPPSVQWELTGITIPVKKPKSPQKWSCAICQLETPNSECQLQEHFGGKKHRSNVAALESRNMAIRQKAETAAEPSSCTDQKTSPITWSCSTCQANGTSEADLKEHLNGRTHQQNTEAQCQEGDAMAKNDEPQEAKWHKNSTSQHAEKPPCSICQASCTSKSELGSHLVAKIQALLEEINNMTTNSKSYEAESPPNIVPQHAEQTSQSNCSICQASSDYQSCCSEPQFENPRRSRRRRKKEVLQGEGQDAESGGMKPVDKLFSYGSDSKSASLEEKRASYFCEVCNLQLNSESMLVSHCKGEEHLEKQKLLNFCEVCNLQCNSGKMLAHHRTGKKHQKNLNANK